MHTRLPATWLTHSAVHRLSRSFLFVSSASVNTAVSTDAWSLEANLGRGVNSEWTQALGFEMLPDSSLKGPSQSAPPSGADCLRLHILTNRGASGPFHLHSPHPGWWFHLHLPDNKDDEHIFIWLLVLFSGLFLLDKNQLANHYLGGLLL